jgi:hypothetical protein
MLMIASNIHIMQMRIIIFFYNPHPHSHYVITIHICVVNTNNKCRYYPLFAFEVMSVLDF